MKSHFRLLTFLGLILFSTSCDKEPDTGEPTITKSVVSVNDISGEEGNEGTTEFSFTLSLDKASTTNILVDYTAQNGTAISGQDYVAITETAIISAGATETQVVVRVVTDENMEADETFELLLVSAVNATIGRNTGVATIINDDVNGGGGGGDDDEGYTTPDSYPGLSLIWADEFNGSSLSGGNWSYETGGGGWGNNELQTYRDGTNNTTVADGKLVIEAKKENGNYTSARIITRGKQSFKYGRVDIRARLPQGQGIWPALWMLGENITTVSWPACGEIDIMELVGHQPNRVHGTVHWQDAGNHADYGDNISLNSGVFADEFHVFSIIWDAQSIKWYMDDNLFNTIDITGGELSEFQEKFFFIFNIAIGGDWPGSPDANTQFPQKMTVDYIRVFQ